MNGAAGSPELSIYVHVPFCAAKCAYCDFVSACDAGSPIPDEGVMWAVRSRVGEHATMADAFAVAVPLFLEEFAHRGLLANVPSIYIGGGTPTMLGDRLVQMLHAVLDQVTLAPDAEVTVEANPDSLTPELVQGLMVNGANRFSLGVQSFDDRILADLGRIHSAEQAMAAAAMLKDAGAHFSIDLMCGVPGLDDDTWRKSLEIAATSGASHVSVYPLTLEQGTRLEDRVANGDLPEPDDDQAADQMRIAAEVLGDGGLDRYEIASFARPGCRSKHNVGYWTGVPYLGVGPSGASMLPIPLALRTPMDHYVRTWPEDWRARFVINDTMDSFLGYLWDRQPAELTPVTAEEAAREDAMLGLRLTDGIEDDLAERAGVVGRLKSLETAGLVAHDEGRWRTTERGWLLGNEVFSAVWIND